MDGRDRQRVFRRIPLNGSDWRFKEFLRTDNLAPTLQVGKTSLEADAAQYGDRWRIRLRNTGRRVSLCTRLEDDRNHPRRGFAAFDRNHFHLMPGEERTVTVRWSGVFEGERALLAGGWNTAAFAIQAGSGGGKA